MKGRTVPFLCAFLRLFALISSIANPLKHKMIHPMLVVNFHFFSLCISLCGLGYTALLTQLNTTE